MKKFSGPIRFGIVLAFLVGLAIIAKPVIRWLDGNYWHESLRDIGGRLAYRESWAELEPLPRTLSQAWLMHGEQGDSATPRYRIAHALGASGAPQANTLGALEQSVQRGLHLFEMDIFLDDAGRLRCHHGPAAPPSFDPQNSCTFEQILPRLPASQSWIVLDIKTDFVPTAEKILAAARAAGRTRQLVFQLYRPADYLWFLSHAKTEPLPAPLITAYLSHRSISYLQEQAARLNVPVLTVPVERLAAASMAGADKVLLFTHPVHSCERWLALPNRPLVRGVYTLSNANLNRCAP